MDTFNHFYNLIVKRMTKPCKFCDRKTIEKLPEKVFTIRCGGKDCEHRVLYGLEKEDCRQVIKEK